jgi:hypothetical protein
VPRVAREAEMSVGMVRRPWRGIAERAMVAPG